MSHPAFHFPGNITQTQGNKVTKLQFIPRRRSHRLCILRKVLIIALLNHADRTFTTSVQVYVTLHYEISVISLLFTLPTCCVLKTTWSYVTYLQFAIKVHARTYMSSDKTFNSLPNVTFMKFAMGISSSDVTSHSYFSQSCENQSWNSVEQRCKIVNFESCKHRESKIYY